MNKRKKTLIATIISSTIFLVVVIILNQSINSRIKYYETREGYLIRLINDSCEREYRELINISRKYYIVGLICLLITLGSIGLYISEEKNNESRNSAPSTYHQFYEYSKQLSLS